MNASLKQVTEEWNALVQREECAAYRAPASHDPVEPINWGQTPDRILEICPADLREDICEWCYRVTDYCEIDRDVVGIALFYFDRYLSIIRSMNETLVRLVALTSLYLSVKVHSTRKISAVSMASLSQGSFRVDQILKMELCIIKTLKWRLNPPTPSMYLNILSPLFDSSKDDISSESTDPIELSRYLIELSICDNFFMDKQPSCVAYAAVSIVMDMLAMPKKSLLDRGFEYSPDMTELCIERLRRIYSLALPELEESGMAPSRVDSSPTTVTQELS